ncbi:MAG: pirin family protein [Sandaracinaceae bacterium]|nr:pirin family protein [Sandaracinaceae bacterium]
MSELGRRDTLKILASASAAAAVGCRVDESPAGRAQTPHEPPTGSSDVTTPSTPASADAVLGSERLGFLWRTVDPFLFCAHHLDRYPTGNAQFGPTVPLTGRNMGSDFEVRDGFRMYHGLVVPGFPRHPHRGFETVTVVREGLLDHSDSMGAAARFGGGDVQWITAGRGIQHSEMFPLLSSVNENPLELFQIWLNLPRADKMVDPYFTMLWNETIARAVTRDEAGRATEVAVIAGRLGDTSAPPPPPNSWASARDNDVAIWTVKLEPGAHFTLPAANAGTRRNIYLHQGAGLRAAGRDLPAGHQFELRADVAVDMVNGPEASEFLLLQGKPIGEPVAQHGPFVMNTRQELQQAYMDFQRTQFGGWPWRADDPVHGATPERFARHADGREERPVRG